MGWDAKLVAACQLRKFVTNILSSTVAKHRSRVYQISGVMQDLAIRVMTEASLQGPMVRYLALCISEVANAYVIFGDPVDFG